MKVNKNKVLVIPRSQSVEFTCPCPICVEKRINSVSESYNLNEIKNVVQDILDKTSLSTKECEVQISFNENGAKKNTQRITNQPGLTYPAEIKPSLLLSSRLEVLVGNFNRNYRHVLMCELDILNENLVGWIDSYQSLSDREGELESELWTIQNILISVKAIVQNLEDIVRENFIISPNTQTILALAVKVRKILAAELRNKYNNALAQPDFQPLANLEDVSTTSTSW